MRTRHKTIVAVYLIMRRGEDVLFLRRANTGFCDGQFGLPSGHVDAGEPVAAAGIREAMEEIGVEIQQDHLKLVHVRDRAAEDGHRLDCFFEVSHWLGEPKNIEPHKCSELAWVNPDTESDVIPYIKAAFDEIRSGAPYSTSGWED